MKQKFLKKFFLTTILILVLCITFITVILSVFVSTYSTEEKKGLLETNCHAVAEACSEMDLQEFEMIGTSGMFSAMASITDAEIFITDSAGNVIFCSCDDWAVDGLCMHNNGSVPTDILEGLSNKDYSGIGDLDGLFDRALFTHATLIKNSSNESIGSVFSVLSPSNIQDFYKGILRLFFLSALVPITIMFVAEYFISYRFTKPITLMTEASHSMANGDFSKRIPVTGKDEINELAVAFNQMANSLVQIEGTRRKFIANVSHEIKTPMTTIGGFIDGIIDGTIPPEKHQHYLSIVSSEVKRLSRLVESMLSLSKLESGELQINYSNFDICEMIFKIVVSQEQRIDEKNLEIRGLDTLEPVTVSADYDLLYQVVYNLVDNAVKFSNEGGIISFGVKASENQVSFKICNTGEGIDQKDLPFIFDRFYKADKSRSKVKDRDRKSVV